jgi:hypothetical protein
MINKIDEQRKWKNVNNEEGRENCTRLRNKLKEPQVRPRINIWRAHVTRSWNCKEQDIMI